jgi:hypothetical protein
MILPTETTGPPSFAAAVQELPRRFLNSSPRPVGIHLAVNGPEPGNWLVRISAGACRVYRGFTPDADATVHLPSDVGLAIASGRLPPAAAYARGEIAVEGDVRAAAAFARAFAWEETNA